MNLMNGERRKASYGNKDPVSSVIISDPTSELTHSSNMMTVQKPLPRSHTLIAV